MNVNSVDQTLESVSIDPTSSTMIPRPVSSDYLSRLHKACLEATLVGDVILVTVSKHVIAMDVFREHCFGVHSTKSNGNF